MNCDRIARWYRWLEYAGFGRALERRREAFLNDLADVRRRRWEMGTGRALAALVAAAPEARIDYVDVSKRMLQLARARAGTERVKYIRDDALSAPLREAEYDLIVTHFFLDCLEEGGSSTGRGRIMALPGSRTRPLGDLGIPQAGVVVR